MTKQMKTTRSKSRSTGYAGSLLIRAVCLSADNGGDLSGMVAHLKESGFVVRVLPQELACIRGPDYPQDCGTDLAVYDEDHAEDDGDEAPLEVAVSIIEKHGGFCEGSRFVDLGHVPFVDEPRLLSDLLATEAGRAFLNKLAEDGVKEIESFQNRRYLRRATA